MGVINSLKDLDDESSYLLLEITWAKLCLLQDLRKDLRERNAKLNYSKNLA